MKIHFPHFELHVWRFGVYLRVGKRELCCSRMVGLTFG